ncbi:MAG: DUF4136 domain-containing protein [Myxococcaceae bacterium]|nr:DUF4136 domain-containing protein [Myxococcaceae bacterium]MCI0670766.1 DUF4136 domain-containing protein [Myxococcaceae bacterium]
MTTPRPQLESARPRALRSRARLGALLAGGIALTLSACASAIQVTRDFDPDADFTAYRTFAIRGGEVIERTNSGAPTRTQLEERLETALRNTLQARGLEENDASPDVYVTYVAGAQDRTQVESWGVHAQAGMGWRGGWGMGGWGRGGMGMGGWWGPSYQRFWSRTYTQGSLMVDMVDAHTQQLVWRAYSSAEVTPEKLAGPSGAAFIQEVLDKAFEAFPPAHRRR